MTNASNFTVVFSIPKEPYATCTFVILSFGIVSNALIVAATVHRKTDLKDKTNWLICCLAILDFLSCISALFIPFELWFDWTFITNERCFWMALPQVFALSIENFLILFVSVDRLLILTMPLRHENWKTKKYLFLMTFPSLIYTLAICILGANSTSPHTIVPVCMVPTAMHGPAFPVLISGGVILSWGIIATNIVCYFVSKSHSNSASEVHNRLRGSVAILGIFYCFTTFAAIIGATALELLGLSPKTTTQVTMCLAWLLFTNQSSNALIYAARSKQYRKAFKTVLGIKNQVANVTNVAPRSEKP